MLAPDAYMDGDGKVEGKGYKGHIYEPVVDQRIFEIPYGSLLPVSIANMLTAGRCISADHVAESGVRAILLCMMTGEAALAVRDGVTPSEISVKELQSILKQQNRTLPV